MSVVYVPSWSFNKRDHLCLKFWCTFNDVEIYSRWSIPCNRTRSCSNKNQTIFRARNSLYKRCFFIFFLRKKPELMLHVWFGLLVWIPGIYLRKGLSQSNNSNHHAQNTKPLIYPWKTICHFGHHVENFTAFHTPHKTVLFLTARNLKMTLKEKRQVFWAVKRAPGCLVYFSGMKSYLVIWGYFINHYKDPY